MFRCRKAPGSGGLGSGSTRVWQSVCVMAWRLPNILEEGVASGDRQTRLQAHDDTKHSRKTPPDAHADKFARIGHDIGVQQNGLREGKELFTERHIFEDRLIGKPLHLLKENSMHKHGLIAIDHTRAPASVVIQAGNDPQTPILPGKPMAKTTGLTGRVGL